MWHHQSDPDHNVLYPLPFHTGNIRQGRNDPNLALPDLFTSIVIVGIVISESYTPSGPGHTVAFQLLYYPSGHDGHWHIPVYQLYKLRGI